MGGSGGALVNHFWVHFFVLLSIFAISRSSDPDCVYTVYIRTGSIFKAGTDSIISLTLYDASGYGIRISNLEAWGGLMGKDYNYFERGNLDIFSGKGPCLTAPVCALNLTSDGSGPHHGWYCNYVELTTTGVHKPCSQQLFTVEQWLATDTSPYELTAIRNYCGNKISVTGYSASLSNDLKKRKPILILKSHCCFLDLSLNLSLGWKSLSVVFVPISY